jgi:hypothetical protein
VDTFFPPPEKANDNNRTVALESVYNNWVMTGPLEIWQNLPHILLEENPWRQGFSLPLLPMTPQFLPFLCH